MKLEKIQITKVEIDKSTIYFFAINEENKIIGKCGFKIRENATVRCIDASVEEDYQGKGVYKRMNSYRQKYLSIKFKGWKVESYCRKSTKKIFESSGYKEKKILYLMEKQL